MDKSRSAKTAEHPTSCRAVSIVSGNLKMLTIDGKSVNQNGYPLRH